MTAVVTSISAQQPSPAERVRMLKAEAQEIARQHSREFIRVLTELETFITDIIDGGEAYPVGVREAARRIGPEIEGARLNVTSILDRQVLTEPARRA
jgi:hypothetical protein